MRFVILALYVSIMVIENHSLKILGIFPFIAPSHIILDTALMRGLSEKGHEITLVSPFGENELPKEYSYKHKSVKLTGFKERQNELIGNLFDIQGVRPISEILLGNDWGNEITEATLSHPNLQRLLQSNETFDVVIMEQFFNDGLKVLAHHYKAPLVMLSTIGANNWINPLVGNPANPAYVPDVVLGLKDRMNFYDRVYNTFISIISAMNRHLLFFPKQNSIIKKYFPSAPDLEVLSYNISLVLLNSHPATNQPVPLVPNMVEIGGYHVKPPSALPSDLQNWLDAANEGVVYFSMGSNLRNSEMPEKKLQAILKSFGKLKEKVLMKWETDVLPDQPMNVKLGKWLPQQGILCHPNVKVFITHGGLLSLTETVYCGVPVISIPIFGDQFMNAANAEAQGYGILLPYEEISEEELSKDLNEILFNKKYRDNVKMRSKVFHDRPMKPMDAATYWIEYVARHNGAPHFRSAALDLAWYQYLLLDVLFVIIGILLAVLLALKFVISLLFCNKNMKNKTSNKDKISKKNKKTKGQ